MKKLPLFLTLTLFIVVVGGYYLYNSVINKPALNAWELVPSEAIFVYEGSSCESCLKELQASTVLSLINKAAFPDNTDSLTGFTDFILSNFRQGSLVSLHITKKDDFDFVFYLPHTNQLDQQFNALVEKIKKEKGGKNVIISDREYNGTKIFEVSLKGRTFSWVKMDNMLVASFTPVLIEDVVRTYNQDTRTFQSELGGVYKLPTVKKDGGNIYLNLRKAAEWLSLFSTDTPAKFVHQLGQSALLDVKINDQSNFVLNGFSLDSVSNPNYILSSFGGQQPVSFTLKSFVSNRALMFASYGISDGRSFTQDLQQFNRQNKPLLDTLQKIATSLQVDVAKLTSKLSGELGVCWMESKGKDLSKIMIINSPNSTKDWLTAFNTISEKLSIDTVFYEKFSDYEIRELPLYRFPEKVFWPLVSGFSTSYYTSLGNSIFIGEDLEELKRFLEDIDREETWGKSVAQNHFLESTLLESNVSLYINTPRIWSVLESNLHPRWKKFVQENRSLTNSLGMGAVQFSHLNDSYYTNISWSYKKGGSAAKTPTEVAESDKVITNFNETLAKVFVVKSHVSKTDEILLQDSTFGIRLLSGDGKVLWKLPLDGLIIGDVQQIDYLSNGKLQYLFATPGTLHVIDRLGNYVSPYPLKINDRDIEFLSIVDYDHSKKYRFLVAGKTGKLWMFDKGGTNLEGWTPKEAGEGLSAPARHYRIRGKDYIICVRKDGKVNLMNRRGEMLKNFPLDLNARPSGEYFLETGTSLENTYFVVISRDGFRIKFTVDGKILSRETLVKNTVDSKFSLVAEKDAKSYLILRQESKQFTLFDENLKQIVSSDFLGNNQAAIQYLDFGAGKVYITITDATQDLSFIYDGQGKLITNLPVESKSVAVRPLNYEKIRVFSIIDKSLSIQPF